MYEVTKETLKKAYKPYDIVTNKKGDVGFIQETNVNDCQTHFESQISYAIVWIIGDEDKHAWFSHNELTRHCNIFEKIAECSVHPMGNNERKVKDLFNNWK